MSGADLREGMLRWGMPVWALLMLAVLAYVLLGYQHQDARSVGQGFIYAVLLLNFPISLLVSALFLTLLVAHQKQAIPWVGLLDHSIWGFVVLWLLYLLAGGLQWGLLKRSIARRAQ